MATMATNAPPLPTRSSGFPRISIVCGLGALIALGFLLWNRGCFSRGDGIVDGREYKIVTFFKVTIQHPAGKLEEGRQFDFADRNVPATSLVVPATDTRGPLVRENTNIKAPGVRRVRDKVSARTVEGVYYPETEYVIWEYHLTRTEPQFPPYPVVILKKD